MAVHRLDSHHHSHFFRIFHNGVQIVRKKLQSFLRMAFGRKRICLIGRSCFCAHHAAPQPGGKADMCHVPMDRFRKLLSVGIGQIQIAAQHGDVHLIPGKYIPDVHGKSRCQRFIRGGKFVNHFRQRHMPAGKSQLMYFGNPFLKRTFRGIM